MKRLFWSIILFWAFASPSFGLNFKQVGYFPSGVIDRQGYIKALDINHDGYQDLVFSTQIVAGDSFRIVYYGYRPYNRYIFEDSANTPAEFWDIGDLDGDSLIDVVAQGDSYPSNIKVFEPLNYWSFPKVQVWSWPYEWMGNGVQPMYITDLDQDGLKEILTADAQVIYVFEKRGMTNIQWSGMIRFFVTIRQVLLLLGTLMEMERWNLLFLLMGVSIRLLLFINALVMTNTRGSGARTWKRPICMIVSPCRTSRGMGRRIS